MATINHITKITFTNGRIQYHAFYASGRKRTVFEHQLTNQMLDILLNGTCTKTAYYETGKVEYFYPAN